MRPWSPMPSSTRRDGMLPTRPEGEPVQGSLHVTDRPRFRSWIPWRAQFCPVINTRCGPGNNDARDMAETQPLQPHQRWDSSGSPFPRRYPRCCREFPRAPMPPEEHKCQYGSDNEYDVPMNRKRAPRCLNGQYFRRRHGETNSELLVVDDYSEEPRDKTTAGS